MILSWGRMRTAVGIASLAMSIAVNFKYRFLRGEHESGQWAGDEQDSNVTVPMLCIVLGSREMGPIGAQAILQALGIMSDIESTKPDRYDTELKCS